MPVWIDWIKAQNASNRTTNSPLLTTPEYGIPRLGDSSYRRDVQTLLHYLVTGVRRKTAALVQKCIWII